MPKKYTIIIEKGKDGFYVSDVVGLPGGHTQGKTIDMLLKRTKEGIKSYLKKARESDASGNCIGVYQVEV